MLSILSLFLPLLEKVQLTTFGHSMLFSMFSPHGWVGFGLNSEKQKQKKTKKKKKINK